MNTSFAKLSRVALWVGVLSWITPFAALAGTTLTTLSQSSPLIDPIGIVPSPDGTTLYVTDYSANAIFKLPASGGAPVLIASGPLVENTRNLTISPDGSTLYVAGWGRGEIVRVSVSTGAQTVIASGGALQHPHGIVISPDGATLYIADNFAGKVFRLPVGGGTPVAISTNAPFGTSFSGPAGIAISADGSFLYVSAGTAGLFQIPSSGGNAKLLASGELYGAVTVAPAGTVAYVVVAERDYLTSDLMRGIATVDLTQTTTQLGILTPLRTAGGGVAISPDGQTLFAADTGFLDRYNGGPIGEPGKVWRISLGNSVTVPSTDQLVSYWKADGNGTDETGRNPATVAAGYVAAHSGQGFYFDGGDHNVIAGPSDSLNWPGVTNQLTVSAWVRWDGGGNPDYHPILRKCTTNNSSDGFPNGAPWQTYALGLDLSGRPFVTISDGVPGTNGVAVAASAPVTLGGWAYIVGTYDGAHLKIYVNGVLQNTLDTNLHIGSREGYIVLGRDSAVGGNRFHGVIDEVRIYSRALSAAEINGEVPASVDQSTVTALQLQVQQLSAQVDQLLAQLKSCNDDDAALLAQVASLNAQLASAQATITSLQGQVSSLTSTNQTLQTQLGQANSQIASLNTQLQSANTAIQSLQTQIATLTGQLADAQSTIASLQGQVATLTTQNASLSADKAALTAANKDLQTQLDGAKADLAQTKSDLQMALDANKTLQTQLANVQSQLDAANAQIASLSAKNAQLTDQVAKLTTDNATLSAQNTKLTSDNAALTSQNGNLTAANAALTAANQSLQTQLSTAQTEVSQLNTSLQNAVAANQALQTQAASLQSQLNAANNQVATLTTQNSQLAAANAQLTSQNQQLSTQNAAVISDIQTLTQLFKSAFNDPTFQLPGTTPQQQLQNLVTAISQLNNGQRQALYKNLGGTK